MNQPAQPGGSSSPNIWGSVILVVLIVIVLSAFKATKKFAYIIGFLALAAILLPAWRKAGYPTGF
jgi:hypothetical protein